MNKYFQNSSPVVKLLMTGFLMTVSFLLMLIIGVILSVVFFDLNIFDAAETFSDYSNPHSIALLKMFQILQSIGFFVLPALAAAYLFSNKGNPYLNWNVPERTSHVFMAIFVMLMALPAVNLFAIINAKMQLPEFMSGIEKWMMNSEQDAKRITEAFLNVKTSAGIMVNIVMIAVIPAIGEELLFRGVLQRIFSDWFKNVHWGIIVTAILFSAIHMQFYGFIPRFLMGVLFGYLLVWSKSIWIPIIAHFVNNGLAVIFAVFLNSGDVPKEVESFGGDASSWYYGILSLVLTGGLLYFVFRKVE